MVFLCCSVFAFRTRIMSQKNRWGGGIGLWGTALSEKASKVKTKPCSPTHVPQQVGATPAPEQLRVEPALAYQMLPSGHSLTHCATRPAPCISYNTLGFCFLFVFLLITRDPKLIQEPWLLSLFLIGDAISFLTHRSRGGDGD